MTKQGYIEALKAKAGSNAEFDALIEVLRKDRSIRQAELRDIAISFLGYDLAKSKSRKYLLQQIIDRQALDARQAARISSHSRLQAW